MRYLIALAFAGFLAAQGTDPKRSPEEYDVHTKMGTVSLGAEYMVHSFSGGDAMFLAKDYLVVEVALYPPKGESLTVQNTDFTLCVNGKKEALLSTVGPQFVASSLQRLDWTVPTNSDMNAGTQGGQLPPRTPIPRNNPTGTQKEPVDAGKVLLETALVEGEHRGSFSGFIYFPYTGKVTGIKTLELHYRDAVLKIR